MPHPGTPEELVMPHLGTPEEPVMPHLAPRGYRARATVSLTSSALPLSVLRYVRYPAVRRA